MIEDNTYEENVKDFNRMFFKLDDKEFNWNTHAMIDLVVEMIEAEYAMNCMVDDSNVIYIDRFQDVLKWADYQKFMCPGGSVPPISYSGAAPFGYGKTAPKRRKQLVMGRDGIRKRKKYL